MKLTKSKTNWKKVSDRTYVNDEGETYKDMEGIIPDGMLEIIRSFNKMVNNPKKKTKEINGKSNQKNNNNL